MVHLVVSNIRHRLIKILITLSSFSVHRLQITNAMQHIYSDHFSSQCHLSQDQAETVERLISGCSQLAGTQYKLRHDNVASYIHWLLCRKYEIIDMSIPADKNILAKEDEKLGWDHSQKPPNNLHLSMKFMISYCVFIMEIIGC